MTLQYGTQHNIEKGCMKYDKNFVLGVALLNAIIFCAAMINGVLKSVVLLSIIMPSQFQYAQYHYAECYNAECHYALCHYA